MRCLLLCIPIALALATPAALAEDGRGYAHYYAQKLGRGINLGNTYESANFTGHAGGADDFRKMSRAGFSHVRIPVRWSMHASAKPPYAIHSNFLAQVTETVNQALACTLIVILNIHHYDELYEDPEQEHDRFLALWRQLGEHFKDYPKALYFELLNEPRDKLTPELWNEYAADALEVVRETNPDRAVLVGSGNWNTIAALSALELPAADRNVIVTFHYYSPFTFTHQGASWTRRDADAWVGTTWEGTERERRKVRGDMQIARNWGRTHDRPVHMGEFGVYSRADMESRVRWTAHVARQAEEYGIPWSYWEYDKGFGAYNPDLRRWRRGLLEALIPRQ